MKRRFVRITLGVCIGLALLAGGIFVLILTIGEWETRYEGRTRYAWTVEINSPDAAVSNRANAVLNKEIIPGLTKTMFQDTNDSQLRLYLVANLNQLPGVNIFFRPAAGRRADAASGLGEFGPAAVAAVPSLLRAMQGHDPAVRGPAAVSLGKIRAKPEALVPMLISYLDQEDMREAAADALGEYGPAAKPAVARLRDLLKVRDKDLHHAVEEALKKIDRPSGSAAEP